MKKFILTILLMSPIWSFGQDAILLQMLQGDFSSYDGRYERFMQDGVPYAFVEVNTNLLSAIVPEAAAWSTKEDGTQKTLAEWVLPESIVYEVDGTNCIIPLAGSQINRGRKIPTSYRSMILWEYYLVLNGIPLSACMTIADRNELLFTDRYRKD